jgi:hypothetical protein
LSVSPSSATDDGVKVVEGSNNAVLARTGSAYSYKGVGASSTLLYSNNTLSFLADGSSNMTFHNGGNERMRIDASGNLGLGVTPSAWNGAYKAVQLPTGSIVSPNKDHLASGPTSTLMALLRTAMLRMGFRHTTTKQTGSIAGSTPPPAPQAMRSPSRRL